MTSNSLCQKLERIKKGLGLEELFLEIDKLIEEYKKTGKEDIYQQVNKKIGEAQKQLEELETSLKNYFSSEEYKKEVIALLEDWYRTTKRGKKDISEFISQIEIKENGKVKVERIDLAFLNLKSFYLPKLIDEVEVLDCSKNQLTQLPKLPNGLKSFNCEYNQLTQLPELPDGLEILSCSFNKLTQLPELPKGLKELYCEYNQLTQLPELPDGLRYLVCFNNQLTQLPKLPDGLEWFDCSNNQFTQLPELPNRLEYLNCSNNYLSEEEIEKIKSHKNYNEYWRIEPQKT